MSPWKDSRSAAVVLKVTCVCKGNMHYIMKNNSFIITIQFNVHTGSTINPSTLNIEHPVQKYSMHTSLLNSSIKQYNYNISQ